MNDRYLVDLRRNLGAAFQLCLHHLPPEHRAARPSHMVVRKSEAGRQALFTLIKGSRQFVQTEVTAHQGREIFWARLRYRIQPNGNFLDSSVEWVELPAFDPARGEGIMGLVFSSHEVTERSVCGTTPLTVSVPYAQTLWVQPRSAESIIAEAHRQKEEQRARQVA
jgi:hypothetical protein